jgi:virginiamycin B lyase
MLRKSVARLPLAALIAGVSTVAGSALAAEGGPGLPDGEARVLVESFCVACHDTNYIPRSGGYTAEHWRELVLSMVELNGRPQLDQIVDYLAANFPPTTDRRPNLVEGPVNVSFENWKVPTLGQMSRDPAEAPDGSIWWVGQYPAGNLVGRLDPETGEMKEYKLPPNSHPHSVTPAADGMIWVSGNGNGTIVRLDPATEEMKVYPMPDPAARDPHTMVFDSDGMLWFSSQFGNMVGRLDPSAEDGNIELITMPVENSRPYALKFDPSGDLWVNCRNSPCIYRIDTDTLDVRTYAMAHPSSWARRLAVTSDGMVWYGDTERGTLARLNPETEEITEWPSPSGANAEPYFIEVIDDIIWYDESGKRPDALVRFDPKTETFQSWAIPSAQGFYGGIARHGRATRDGDLLLHQGSSNNIMRISINEPD